MSAPIFNPPPGWPRPPQGWRPGPGWTPDPSWPPAPAGWSFWIDPATGSAAPPVAVAGPRRRRSLPLVLGLVGGGLVLILVVAGAFFGVSALLRPPPATGIYAGTDDITTVEQAVAYYDEQKALVEEFMRDEPFGYSTAGLAEEFADLDAELADELAGDASVSMIIVLAGTYTAQLQVMQDDLADWRTEFAAKPENEGNATGTEAEAVLDRVSGGVSAISTTEADPCDADGEDVLACVKGGSVVYVPSALAGLSDAELVARTGVTWELVMTHEFAHVIQNRFEDRLLEDPTFVALFPPVHPDLAILTYNLEHSADCMAALHLEGYVNVYPGECTPEQTAFAATMWDGSFYTG